MGTSRVTVIIPVYNREQILGRAIDSVLRQTYTEWDLLVVDDCSTDASVEIVLGYNDARIKILRTPRNLGAAAARNLAIRYSMSPYVALLDSDDQYHPDFLSESLSSLQRTASVYGFSYTGVAEIQEYNSNPPQSRTVWTLPTRFERFNKPYLYQLQIGTSAGIVLKREVFEKIGLFDESFQAAEDTDFFIRASEFYRGFPIHKNLIFKDNTSGDRLTKSYSKNAKAYKIILDKYRDDIHKAPSLIYYWYYKSMWLNFYNGDRPGAKSRYIVLRNEGLVRLKTRMMYMAGVILPSRLFIMVHKKIANFR